MLWAEIRVSNAREKIFFSKNLLRVTVNGF